MSLELKEVLLKAGEILLIFFIAFIASNTLKFIFNIIERRIVKRTKSIWDDVLFDFLKGLIPFVIYLSAVLYITFYIIKNEFFERIVYSLTILVAGIFLARFLDCSLDKIRAEIVEKTDTKFDDLILPFLRKALKLVIYVIVIIMVLDRLGYDVTTLVAGIGIAGLAISFAAKDTLENVIAGIFIILDKPFVLGDRIEVWNAPKNSATWGDVVEIGLRSTHIKTTDNILIVIPNSEIMRRDIINYTAVSPMIRVRMPVGISYESDLKKAEEILLKISEMKGISKKPLPQVIVKNFGESSVDLELRIWITQAKNRRKIQNTLNKKIHEEFKKHRIEMPYPKRDIFLKSEMKE
ncbi:MAG: mechanosensitive ion channel family protein [Candidatus Methanofastidiosia archaeon]